jgi:hypothetical protein
VTAKAPKMSIDFPKEELVVIDKWREIKAFERQVIEHILGSKT